MPSELPTLLRPGTGALRPISLPWPRRVFGRLCPKGIFVWPRMDRYGDESRHIMEIMAQTGAIGPLSGKFRSVCTGSPQLPVPLPHLA